MLSGQIRSMPICLCQIGIGLIFLNAKQFDFEMEKVAQELIYI